MSFLSKITHEEREKFRIEARNKRYSAIADFISDSPDNLKNYYRGVPDVHKWNWLRSITGKNTIGKAVKAKCIDCSGYDRAEMYNCTVTTCPLYHHRPKQK